MKLFIVNIFSRTARVSSERIFPVYQDLEGNKKGLNGRVIYCVFSTKCTVETWIVWKSCMLV